jgi:hypothetical protein
MNVRRNIYTLSDQALRDFQDALNAIKADGTYNTFIERHHHSMMTATPWQSEQPDTEYRNVAHRGPAFLPWHRYFCRELELALQAKNPRVTLPYWDWAADSGNPIGAPLWNGNPAAGRVYVGGDGDGPGGRITTGPFKDWVARVETISGALVNRPGIVRELGQDVIGNPAFPTQAQVTHAVNNFNTYDTAPWSLESTGSFRNRLEGWRSALPNEQSPHLHNVVHVWVGGDMGPGTSPNDPVFFIHHCNVDRIWALWQHAHPSANYLPASNGPAGHNLNDQMQHLTSASPTPAASLDYRRTMGFIYDTDPPLVDLPDATVNFNDVPELETTWRAAVFHVRAGRPIHLNVVPGGLSGPYSLSSLGGSLTHTPVEDNAPFDEVRLWFAFTGGAVGAAPNGAVQVHCPETNQTFNITLTGNTIQRPTTGVVLCLDQSGSMSEPAGTGPTRMQVLHEAAARCVELIRDNSGAGVVSFDHDAHPGIGLAPFTPSSSQRADVLGAINALAPTGATSIGDGLVLARTTLNAAAGQFQQGAIVVLTDGLENQPLLLSQVGGSINERTYAIGLGTAQQVSSGALRTIAAQTDGFILLTGALTPGTDNYFLLSKYFLQILMAVTNEHIVEDPSGFVTPGNPVRIPFSLAETDIDATAVLMLDVPAVRLALETPDGTVLKDSALADLGAQVEQGTNMTFCRMALPLPVGGGAGAHEGQWHAVLTLDKTRHKREMTKLSRSAEKDPAARERLVQLRTHGVRYSFTTSAWSNLKLDARLKQASVEPGATLRLDAALVEFGQPVAGGRAQVDAEVVRPDGVSSTMALAEESPGTFGAELTAAMEGVWRFRVLARGHTFRGSPFTREQLLSAPIVRGGDNPKPPEAPIDPECVFACLTRDPKVRRLFKANEITAETLARCMKRCRGRRGGLPDAECLFGCLTRDEEVQAGFEKLGIDADYIAKCVRRCRGRVGQEALYRLG